ncbi:MAG: hypothetical protein ACYDBX_04585 [Patescibacteria group bacterium]
MLEETRDLVWLPKSLCELINTVQSEQIRRDAVLKYVDETKEYLKADINSFNEIILDYRVKMEVIKNEFEALKNKELQETYDIWEQFEKDIPKVRAFVEKLKAEIKPLHLLLNEIQELMQKLDKWSVEDLLETLEKINGMDSKTREIINFLFENYKQKEH